MIQFWRNRMNAKVEKVYCEPEFVLGNEPFMEQNGRKL